MNYKELLKDGRWQIRKTEIMLRDNYCCRACGAKASDGVALNVHHLHYRKGKKPWEYLDSELMTLCEKCHKAHHKSEKSKIYGVNIGDFVRYRHGDYDNFGIIYDVDLLSMKAKMAGIDDGGDYSRLVIDELEITKNGFLLTYNSRQVEKVTIDLGEDNFFWYSVANILNKIKQCKEISKLNELFYCNGYLNSDIEKNVLKSNCDKLFKNNALLNNLISG